jgi:hypothetical protein
MEMHKVNKAKVLISFAADDVAATSLRADRWTFAGSDLKCDEALVSCIALKKGRGTTLVWGQGPGQPRNGATGSWGVGRGAPAAPSACTGLATGDW